jgi:hypothetical protein
LILGHGIAGIRQAGHQLLATRLFQDQHQTPAAIRRPIDHAEIQQPHHRGMFDTPHRRQDFHARRHAGIAHQREQFHAPFANPAHGISRAARPIEGRQRHVRKDIVFARQRYRFVLNLARGRVRHRVLLIRR